MYYVDYLNHIVVFLMFFLWQYNSKGFEKICITWNKAVRKMYSLPYDTHRWIIRSID